MLYVKAKGKITNGEYQDINEISERIASREISELVKANKTIYLYSHIDSQNKLVTSVSYLYH